MDARLTYRAVAAQGASPLRLVILLYEQAIEDLRQALAALAQGDIEGRTQKIKHAVLVIGHLQASLDMAQGGEVAANLERFYQETRAGLLNAQIRQSAAGIQKQLSSLMRVRQAWQEVERQSAPPIQQPEPTSRQFDSERPSFADWKA
ncbi:MAG TPA: flagellar export chaperone FliS [Verrucomicrobiae bacterium]|jgi:flagellar secretion chaperone FliS|nr:flagellar export chaperone FliS [Verrucomicrobiae bacterium]